MNGRRCGTCKHFEHAPIWRKGWCRNPLLYSPQQSQLVSEHEIDCDRGMGNYWEPSLDYLDQTSRSGFQEPVAQAFSSVERATVSTGPLRSSSGMPVFPVSGSSGYNDPPPPGGPDRGPLWGGGDDRGDLGYYQEERYWTDYLRIAAPLLGVAILVIIFWFWIASFLGDDNGDNGEAADATATSDGLPTAMVTTTASPTGEVGTEGPGTIVVPGDGTAGADGTQPPGDEATTPPDDGGEQSGGPIYIGALAQVANTGGTGVNVRSDASTDSEILDVYLDGTEVQVTDGPFQAEDFVWWQVTRDGVVGYIVEDYLVVIE